MKEDILEQLVDDYLQSKGYFTRHNIKFRPRRDHPDFISHQDSNHSDIDVIGFNPHLRDANRVWAVSCKSWQTGFRDERKLRLAWKFFRELVSPKWSEAFLDAVEKETGTRRFTYVLAVTVVRGDASIREQDPRFAEAMEGNPIRLIELSQMLDHFRNLSTTTVASSEIGRVLQLMRAAEKGKQALAKAVEAQSVGEEP